MAVGQLAAGGVVGRVLEAAAQVADIVAQAAGRRRVGQVEAMHGFGCHQPVLHQVLHRIRQRCAVDQVVTVETVLVEFVQIHVVQAGAAVQHAVVDHKALEVQHAEQFAGLHRHAVDRHLGGMALGHGLVPGAVARLFTGADQPALGAPPIDQHHDVQLRACGLGGVQGVVDLLPRLVLLQVQRDDIDALGSLGIFSSRQRRNAAAPDSTSIASVESGKARSLGNRERLKNDGIRLAMGRIRRGPELTPWGCSGLVASQ